MMKSALANPKTKPILYLNLRPFVIAGLSAVIFFPPFLRGLFFAPEKLITHMITAVVFLFFAFDRFLAREKEELTFSWLDISVIALLIAYMLSLINAVNLRATVGEILELINALIIYWLVSRHIKDPRDIERLLKVLFFAAVGVAVIGLGAATGHITYPAAFDGKIIMSTFQYRNTLAAYMAMMSVIGLTLWVKQENPIKMAVYALGNLFLLIVLLATQSRGGWIIYPFGVLLLFLGVAKENIWRYIYYFFLNLGLALPVSKLFLTRVLTGNGTGGLKVLILAALVVLLVQIIIWMVLASFKRMPLRPITRKLLTSGGLIYIAIVVSIYFLYSAGGWPLAGARFIPVQVIQRANTIHSTDPSFMQRLEFDRDALKIIKDHPIIGAGGGGWEALYHSYQRSHFFSTEVHNHFLQVWVEAGTVGFFAFTSIWFAVGRILFSLWRQKESITEYWNLIWSAAIAAVTLGLHSFFDFNLSMFALVIILWGIFGIVRAGERLLLERDRTFKTLCSFAVRPWKYSLALIVLSAILFIPANNIYRAGKIGALGAQAMAAQNLIKARGLMEQAAKLDPYSASYQGDLAQIYTLLGLAENNRDMIEKARNYAREAVKREPYNYKLRSSLAAMYFLQGDLESYVKEAESFLQIDPLEVTLYEQLANAYLTAAKGYLDMGDAEKAASYLAKVHETINKLENKSRTVMYGRWQGPKLEITPKLLLTKGQAFFLAKKYDLAVVDLEKASKAKQPPKYADVWLAAAYFKAGKADKAQEILNKISGDRTEALQLYNLLIQK